MCGVCGSRPLIEQATPAPRTFSSPAETPATYNAARKSNTWLKIGLPVVIGVFVIAGIVVALTSSDKIVLHIKTTQYRSTCGELTSNDAVYDGAPIVVRNAGRTFLGSGVLSNGTTGHGYNKTDHWVSTCTFKTDVSVSKNESSYLIRAGSASGGALAFSRRELVNNNWNASVTVGYDYDPPVYGNSYNDGYNWGYANAYSSSDCDWWANGPSYDNASLWESGCRAGYLDNPY